MRHLENDAADPDREGNGEEEFHPEPATHRGGRHQRQESGPEPVGDDQQALAGGAVNEHPGEEAEHEEGEPLARREQTHLEGRGVERQSGGEWQRQHRDVGAEVGDRVGGPEFQEFVVGPDPAVRQEASELARPRGMAIWRGRGSG